MNIMSVPVTVGSVPAGPLPSRILSLDLTIKNPSSLAICVLDAAWRVETGDGHIIATGRLFREAGPTIEGMQDGYAHLSIPMTPQALSLIEERRGGGDVVIHAFSSALIAYVVPSTDRPILSQPSYAQFDNRGQGLVEHLIPQSEWVKLLSAMQWSELELIELPSRNLRALPIVGRAIERFEGARDCYRRGLWAEAMANCRRAIEALVKETTGEDDMGKSHAAITQLVGEGPRAEAIDDLLLALSSFLHLARHEAQPPVEITPTDARLALHLTGAILAYLGEPQK